MRERLLTAGLSLSSRHAAAALATSTSIVVCEQERATRVRGAGPDASGLPDQALELLVDRTGRTRDDIGRYATADPGIDKITDRPVHRIDHHLAHASTAYLCSPYSVATILVCDQKDPKVKELVCVAVNAAATHMYEPGIREHVRRAVREQMRSGAKAIKVIATGGVLTPGVSADFTAFTFEELQAAADEAHTWNRGIAAHAIGAAGIENAVRAGIDSIEHGSQISVAVARMMKERGTFHVPTISALRGIVDNDDQVPAYAVEKGRQVLTWLRDSFRRAVREGVRYACGTDAGTPFTITS